VRRKLFLLLLATVLSACDHVSYYAQAVRGQTSILLARKPIARVLQDPELDPQRREQLLIVESAREFAGQYLGLPANGSFTTFVDPGREHLIWNVFAAPWNSVDLMSWCFPIAGCVGYRGYFSEQAAQRYASRLAEQGFDVYVGGVDAYSTLGWFRDPLPATVLGRSHDQLAGLVFHELAHQRVYLPGDTVFNESFASFVERQGVQLWQASQCRESQVEQIARFQELQQRFALHVSRYREQLRALYRDTSLDEDAMRAGKQELIAAMREDWLAGPDAPAYAGWFNGEINNARLATVAAYYDYVPAFEALFRESGGDFGQFYAEVRAIAALLPEEREQRMNQLLSAPGMLMTSDQSLQPWADCWEVSRASRF